MADQGLERRRDLTSEERRIEPRNADSHLAFMAAGLSTCVSYVNRPQEPVAFVDLDGVMDGRPRRRLTSIVGFNREREVQRLRMAVPVSQHPIDSVNLKDPKLGFYEQIIAVVKQHGVTSGRVRLELASAERQAGLTVNEYETLLMRHDLAEVLRNPFRFGAEKGRHMLAHPRGSPQALDYAKRRKARAQPRARRHRPARVAARAALRPRDRRSAGRFPAHEAVRESSRQESDGQGVADSRYPGRFVGGTARTPGPASWSHSEASSKAWGDGRITLT